MGIELFEMVNRGTGKSNSTEFYPELVAALGAGIFCRIARLGDVDPSDSKLGDRTLPRGNSAISNIERE
jgi:hypothetical protein